MTFQEALRKAREKDVTSNRKFGRNGLFRNECGWATYAEATPYSFFAHLLQDDWEVEESKMDFATAMKYVQEGRTVRRRSWPADAPRALGAKEKHESLGGKERNGFLYLTSENVSATDWEVID